MRNFCVRNAKKSNIHKTGRRCDNKSCGGYLEDTIINIGEAPKPKNLESGFKHAASADIMLCLGSSLRANLDRDIVGQTATNGGKVVIVNLQKTPMDNVAAMVVHSEIEPFMQLVMDELCIEIKKCTLKRWFNVQIEESQNGLETLKVNGISEDGSPYDMFKSVIIDGELSQTHHLTEAQQTNPNTIFKLHFEFHGHWDEPDLEV